MDLRNFYFSGRGRVNRKQLWLLYAVPAVVIGIVLAMVDNAMGTLNETGTGLLSSLFSLALFIPSLLIHIKRLHDRDKSGWWLLIILVPIVGAIWLFIELYFFAGTPGSNSYGPRPDSVQPDAHFA